jgi:hypothetical protein
MWATELQSIFRDQARRNSRPEPDTALFVVEALNLRHCRLERDCQELYFLQEDARNIGDSVAEQHHHANIDLNRRAQGLVALALQQMRSFARDS